MTLVTKKRATWPVSYDWSEWSSLTLPGTASGGTFDGTTTKQQIMTEGHDVSQLGNQSHNVQDIGGEFQSQKIEIFLHHIPGVSAKYIPSPSKPNQFISWSGVVFPSVEVYNLLNRKVGLDDGSDTSFFNSNAPIASGSSLDALGSTAISRVQPLSPVFDASVSVAELYREGLPGFIDPTSNWGGEYLRYSFGYVPLASDAQKAYEAAVASDKLLTQLRRDSGKLVRRSYSEDPVVSISPTTVSSTSPGTVNGGSPSGLLLRKVTGSTVSSTTEVTWWFSGAFTYYLPPNKGWRRSVAELDYLYGIKPGIDTAWNLMPWSWLVDYFGNAGDVFSNLNAFGMDGLVMPYGYVMRKVVTTSQHSSSYQARSANGSWQNVQSSSATVVKTTLQRRRAFPFGFGVLSGSLSTRQISILAALGISRL